MFRPSKNRGRELKRERRKSRPGVLADTKQSAKNPKREKKKKKEKGRKSSGTKGRKGFPKGRG